MTYRDTLAYLSGLNKMGIRFGLDPIRSLLERLHNPQDSYPAVLIAGTNGKGSVAAMTASILSAGRIQDRALHLSGPDRCPGKDSDRRPDDQPRGSGDLCRRGEGEDHGRR